MIMRRLWKLYSVAFLTMAVLTFTSVVRADADLVLNKAVDNAMPAPGGSVEFEITVTNAGPDSSANIEIIDQLPTGFAIPVGMAAFTMDFGYRRQPS